ncbi:MAG: hypothetical protein LBI38_01680 [Oscillospiraceae bacterium]|nr:hypothetical protein [Oscillospiraceae bacterium]
MVAVLAAALLGGGIFLLTRGDNPIINLKGQSSYERAERSFVKNGVTAYSALSGLTESSDGGEVVVKFTPEEYILNFMRDDLYMDVPQTINPTTVILRSAVDGGDVFAGLTYKNGEKEIVSADMWLKGDEFVLYIPKLAEKYLKASIESAGYDVDYSGIYSAASVNMPSDKEFEKIYDAVWDEYFNLTKDAPVKKNAEVSLGGISLKCDAVEIEITEEMAYKLALALLKAVDKSDGVKTYINDCFNQVYDYGYYGSAGFEIDGVISAGIDSLEMLIADANGSESIIVMVVYSNGGNIVKREIFPSGDDGVGFTYTALESKGKYETEVVLKSGETTVKLTDSGENQKGVYTGETRLNVKYKDTEWDYDTWEYREVSKDVGVSASYSGLTFDKDDRITGGDITITSGALTEELGDVVAIKMSFRENGFKGSLELGYVKVATVELTYSEGFSGKPYPNLTGDNSVDMDDTYSDTYYDLSEQAGRNLLIIVDDLDDNGVYDIVGYVLKDVFALYSSYGYDYF